MSYKDIENSTKKEVLNTKERHKVQSEGGENSVSENADEYILDRRRKVEREQLSKDTLETDRRSLKLFCDWVKGNKSNTGLANLDESDLRAFKEHRLKEVNPSTTAKNLRHIKSFFSDQVNDGKLDSNPVEGIDIPETRRRTEVPSQSEFKALKTWLDRQINASDQPEWIHLFMRLACATGMRLGELVQIKWERGPKDHGTGHARSYVHLNAQEQTLTIKFKRKLRRIPVTHVWSVFQHLADRKEDDEIYVFSSPLGGHYDKSYVCRRWKEEVRKVDQLKRPYTCHCIRHAVVTSLMRKDYSGRKIGKLVGHSSAQITDRYGHLVANDLDDMVGELSME